MISTNDVDTLLAGKTTVYSSDGEKVGSIGQIYLDDQSGDPSFATVKTGMFGTSETFVPLAEASLDGNDVRVPYTKDQVKDAPRVEADGSITPEEEDGLYRHYNLGGTGTKTGELQDRDNVSGRESTDRESVGHDTSGPTTDDAMTRSEERLNVGTEKVEAGRMRLRKHVVTENVTTTVPVSREEVVLEREPITEENRGDAMAGPELSEEEHEVILHEERPVVTKETVPVERVRMGKETITDEQTVTEEVRKEQITTDGDDTPKNR
ncbi:MULTISPECIES: PRC and DUF2382 domain-containing protein [unclassified Arthrobacter]|uniref:PRC and DUF2382 domain-containing protein n=1 Tax=unclassified Arthrobacter TaxID=235627 RepID=UPI002E044C0E|nr:MULTISPECIES: PRC and DUF2382 domain-containing protein [unclassified Arthrobacter]MEC5191872.1 uncharacterized protein (TIGR02271 family) [Arthrobacter sp. MP_M4]MEC5202377.1 uncharacterized protein (TIGR02271 family) [Arthrobacter sp. MP_M7]